MPSTVVLYHGTARHFAGFTEASIGLGTEANSALGIHFTEDPAVAADYARSAGADAGAVFPYVLVVMVTVAKALVVTGRDDFFGHADMTPVAGKDGFASVRARLLADGFDAVVADDLGEGISGTWIILRPERIAIAGRMSLGEADNSAARSAYGRVEMVSGSLFPSPGPGAAR